MAVKRLIEFDGHTTVIGRTGSGKTYGTLKSIAPLKCGCLFLDTVMTDKPTDFKNKSINVDTKKSDIGLIRDALKDNCKLSLEYTRATEEYRNDMTYNLITYLMRYKWQKLLIAVDEVHLYSKHGIKALEQIATVGRHKGIYLVAISQRPANISNTIMTQSEKFVIYSLSGMETDYLKRYNIPAEDILEKTTEQYSYVTWDSYNIAGPYIV